MPWTQEDWSIWIGRDRSVPYGNEHDLVVRSILGRLPGASERTLALIGADRLPGRGLIASRYGTVIDLARPGALRGVRDPGSIDVALADMRHASRDELDSLLGRLWGRLSEGAPAVVLLGAAPRLDRPTPFLPAAEPGDRRPASWHEVEVQYRFRRAWYQGVRARRFGGVAGQVIVAIGVRRACN